MQAAASPGTQVRIGVRRRRNPVECSRIHGAGNAGGCELGHASASVPLERRRGVVSGSCVSRGHRRRNPVERLRPRGAGNAGGREFRRERESVAPLESALAACPFGVCVSRWRRRLNPVERSRIQSGQRGRLRARARERESASVKRPSANSRVGNEIGAKLGWASTIQHPGSNSPPAPPDPFRLSARKFSHRERSSGRPQRDRQHQRASLASRQHRTTPRNRCHPREVLPRR